MQKGNKNFTSYFYSNKFSGEHIILENDEFGEVYSCSGGVHAITSGTFGEGDIYDKTRQIAVILHQ
jgi:hypothetical protein